MAQEKSNKAAAGNMKANKESEGNCPAGTHLDPQTGLCVADSGGKPQAASAPKSVSLPSDTSADGE